MRQLLRFQHGRVEFQHGVARLQPLERTQERDERAHQHDVLPGADRRRIEGVDAGAQLGRRMRATPPACVGERIQDRDADRASYGMRRCRLHEQVARGPAAQRAGKRQRGDRAWAAGRIRPVVHRRCAGPRRAGAERRAGEKQPDHHAFDGDPVQVGPQYPLGFGNGLRQDAFCLHATLRSRPSL